MFINLDGGVFRALGALLLPGLSVSSRDASVGAGETYTPDLRQACEHNVTCTGATATIGNPVGHNPRAGFANLLITHIRNASGGAITVTFGTKYKQSAFTDPTDGNGSLILWHYDATNDLWYASAKQTLPNA